MLVAGPELQRFIRVLEQKANFVGNEMLEILSPLWTALATIVGTVIAAATLFFLWSRRPNKAVSYEIISSDPLVNIKEEVGRRLQVLFDGNQVEDVHLVRVRIINSGNIPITPDDYMVTISLDFGANAQILTATVDETNPDNIPASVSIDGTKVKLAQVLLNGGDSVTIKILIGQSDARFNVDGRIVGVKAIKESVEGRTISNIFIALGLLVVFFGVVNTLTLPPIPASPDFTRSQRYANLAIAGTFLMQLGVLLNSRIRRRILRVLLEDT